MTDLGIKRVQTNYHSAFIEVHLTFEYFHVEEIKIVPVIHV